MNHFMFAFNALMPLLLMAFIGYMMRRSRLIDRRFVDQLNTYVFTIALPALIITTFIGIGDFSTIRWDVVGFAVFAVFSIALMGLLIAKSLTTDASYKPVVTQAFFRGNFTLIGIPLALRLGGDETVQMIIILNAVLIPITNLLSIMTFKLWQVKKDEKLHLKDLALTTLKNPLMIAVFLGGVAYALIEGLNLPPQSPVIVYETFNLLSMTATPMALIAIGAQFELNRITAIKKPLMVSVLGRAILVPLLVIILGMLLRDYVQFSGSIAALIGIFASSVAVSSVAVTKGLNGDETFASQVVIFSTGFSVFTIFLIVIVFRIIGLL